MKIMKSAFGTVLWEGEAASIAGAVHAALKMGADLRYADLAGVNLTGAVLTGAFLTGVNLTGAVLRHAKLTGAVLMGAKNLRLPTGETWEDYLTETVPALLTAGGKELQSFRDHWQCHAWPNCPIAYAFYADELSQVPSLLRSRAIQFIQFFDADLIPWPLPTKADAVLIGTDK